MVALILPFTVKAKECREAEEALAAGRAEEALKVFRRLGHRAGVRAVGEHYLARNRCRDAARIFQEIKDVKGLQRLGELYLEQGNYSELEKTLRLIHPVIPPAEYVRVGLRFQARGDLLAAEKAFTAAGEQPRLAEIGTQFLERNDLSNATRLFRKLGARDRMVSVAGRYLESGDLDRADKLYRELGDTEGLRRVESARLAVPPTAAAVEALDPANLNPYREPAEESGEEPDPEEE